MVGSQHIAAYVASLIRHLMTLLAGWLGASGMSDAAAAAEGASGNIEVIAGAVALYAIAQLWSFKQKK